MLSVEHAQKVIDAALSLGADFADLFVEENQLSTIQFLSSKVNEIKSGIDFGIGIRLIYNNDVVYGYTNSKNLDDLIELTHKLGALNKKQQVSNPTPLAHKAVQNIHQVTTGLSNDVALDEKVRYLTQLDQWVREESEKIVQASLMSIQRKQKVHIFNSEGLDISDQRDYIRFGISAIAADAGEQHSAFEGPGALKGWEFSKEINGQEIAKTVARVALTKLTAEPCPAGKMPVIIDQGFGGVIFHEACGHLLETTSVAKKASVFHDKMGEMIAHEALSAVDDGTIASSWGSINIDDEGMETQKTQLIKNGKLVGFLSDRVGAAKCDIPRTGSARKQNYKFAPASRMRNTYIEAGKDKFEDMISSIDKGIYCKRMGGGSVMPGTGEFNFNADESYLIEDGKITRPLKSATLIGQGDEIMTKISMVSDNLSLSAGMCGSVSGGVPVTVGQPAIKVDEILVGGQANG